MDPTVGFLSGNDTIQNLTGQAFRTCIPRSAFVTFGPQEAIGTWTTSWSVGAHVTLRASGTFGSL